MFCQSVVRRCPMVTSQDFAPVCVDYLFQNHLHTDVGVPAWECTLPPPRLLGMSLRCVACGYHGDASERAGRTEVNVQHVGATAV